VNVRYGELLVTALLKERGIIIVERSQASVLEEWEMKSEGPFAEVTAEGGASIEVERGRWGNFKVTIKLPVPMDGETTKEDLERLQKAMEWLKRRVLVEANAAPKLIEDFLK